MLQKIFLAALCLLLTSQQAAHAFDPKQIKTEAGFGLVVGRWLNLSPGLVQWPESRYYQTNLDTRFSFNRAVLFHPSFSLRYGKISVAYSYLSNSLPLELNVSVSRTDLREVGGAPIHPVRGHSLREHRITLSYYLAEPRLALFVEGLVAKRGIAGGYEGTVYEFHPLSGFSFFEKQTGLSVGLSAQQSLGKTGFLLLGQLAVAPYTKGTYTFLHSISALDVRQQQLAGWNARLGAGFGYRFEALTTKLTYRLQTYRTYDRAIRDTFGNFELGTSFNF